MGHSQKLCVKFIRIKLERSKETESPVGKFVRDNLKDDLNVCRTIPFKPILLISAVLQYLCIIR